MYHVETFRFSVICNLAPKLFLPEHPCLFVERYQAVLWANGSVLAESLGRRFISIHHLRLKHSLRNWTTSFYQKPLLFAKENIKRSYHDNARGLYDKIVTVSCAFYNFTFYTFKKNCQLVKIVTCCAFPPCHFTASVYCLYSTFIILSEKKRIFWCIYSQRSVAADRSCHLSKYEGGSWRNISLCLPHLFAAAHKIFTHGERMRKWRENEEITDPIYGICRECRKNSYQVIKGI